MGSEFVLLMFAFGYFGEIIHPDRLYLFIMMFNLGYAMFYFIRARYLRSAVKSRDWKDQYEITNPNAKVNEEKND